MNQFGRYEILGQLDSGGMGMIYRAYDPRFKREVAIKVIASHFSHDPQFRQRFEREAQVVASLQHPAIVPVYDFGEQNGQPYLVMALMLGGSLADHLQQHGPLAPSQAVDLLMRLAPGLSLAHQKGVVHRDLKPNNILFDQQDNPYITDFGIAKLFNAATISPDQMGQVIGTPFYISPEQGRGAFVDGRSDIYSLGVILFEVLTGQLPYDADTLASLIYRHIHEPVPNILAIKPDLPSGCQEVIARAMAKNPSERYPTPSQLVTALSGAVESSLFDNLSNLKNRAGSLFGTLMRGSKAAGSTTPSPRNNDPSSPSRLSWQDILPSSTAAASGRRPSWLNPSKPTASARPSRLSWQDVLRNPSPASGEENTTSQPPSWFLKCLTPSEPAVGLEEESKRGTPRQSTSEDERGLSIDARPVQRKIYAFDCGTTNWRIQWLTCEETVASNGTPKLGLLSDPEPLSIFTDGGLSAALLLDEKGQVQSYGAKSYQQARDRKWRPYLRDAFKLCIGNHESVEPQTPHRRYTHQDALTYTELLLKLVIEQLNIDIGGFDDDSLFFFAHPVHWGHEYRKGLIQGQLLIDFAETVRGCFPSEAQKNVHFVPEPEWTLVGLSQSEQIKMGNRKGLPLCNKWTLVVDVGGGSTDVVAGRWTGQELKGVWHHYWEPIGGGNFDHDLVLYLAESFSVPEEKREERWVELLHHARELKESLSRQIDQKKMLVSKSITLESGDKKKHSPYQKKKVKLDKPGFEKLTKQSRDSFERLVLQALKKMKLDKSDIAQIVLTGGGANLYLVRQIVQDIFGQTPLLRVYGKPRRNNSRNRD